MPRIPRLRVIVESEPHPGDWNMAVDEVLLETAISDEVATLRWYQWTEPTISLGYFQKVAELIDDPVLSRLPVVRRLSGGGAILHDDELTYSLALPASQRLFERPHEFYDIVHQSLIDGLREIGIPVVWRGETLKRADEPLLCFQRQDMHDITLSGFKVVGSAQRRRRGAILQHGSLLRRASSLAPHLPGFAELSAVSLPNNLADLLASRVAASIADSWSTGPFSESEKELASELCQTDHVRGGNPG